MKESTPNLTCSQWVFGETTSASHLSSSELTLGMCQVVHSEASLHICKSSWDVELIRQCHLGVCRFDDLVSTLAISRQVLSARLKALVAADILIRQKYRSRPDRYDYRLTAKGLDFVPVLQAAMCWSERWRS